MYANYFCLDYALHAHGDVCGALIAGKSATEGLLADATCIPDAKCDSGFCATLPIMQENSSYNAVVCV